MFTAPWIPPPASGRAIVARFFAKLASWIDGCVRIDHLGVCTIDPADHRPALRVLAIGFEHGNHVRHGNGQKWPQHRQPCGLFEMVADPPLARQPHQEVFTGDGTKRSSSRSMATGEPARQRKQASPGPPVRGPIGHRSEFVGMESSRHPRPQSHRSVAPQPTFRRTLLPLSARICLDDDVRCQDRKRCPAARIK